MTGRIPIEDITPAVAGGRYPARAVAGEYVPIAATVYREGHDLVGANVVWKGPDGRRRRFVRMEPGPAWTSRWYAEVVPDTPGRWTFAIEAWSDPYATWRHNVEVKIEAGQGAIELANDLADGVSLMQRASQSIIRIGGDAARDHRGALAEAARNLADASLPLEQRV